MAFNYRGGSYMGLANAKNQQQQSFFDQLAQGINQYQRGKDRELMEKRIETNENVRLAKLEQEANSPKALADQGFMKAAKGLPTSPDEQAAMKYADAQNQARVSVDRYGNKVTNQSIFDMLSSQSGAITAPKRGKYGQGSNPAITQGYSDIAPSILDGESIPSAPNTLEKPAGMVDVLMPQAPSITNKAEEMTYGAQLDIQKEKAKQDILTQKNEQKEAKKQAKEDSESVSILNDMLEYNSKTLEVPYAGLLQPVTRLTDPDAAKNMALLNQQRLRLAAPLAKQLGVNPTDKDFQNTLDQIFNENESRETRAAQIKSLIGRISGKSSSKANLNSDALRKQADDAIARGADPAVVNKRLEEMLNGQ